MDNVLVLGSDVDGVLDEIADWEFVGSRVTCDPVPPDADLDVLGLVLPDQLSNVVDRLQGMEFDTGGSGSMDACLFVSMKRDQVNLILTKDIEFYDRFLLATNVAKRLNLLKKEDRLVLFQAILYGVCVDVSRIVGGGHD